MMVLVQGFRRHRGHARWKCAFGVFLTTCLGSEALFAADEPVTLPAVTVIGSTPLPGVGLDKDQVAAPVQTGNSAQIERSNAIDLPGYLLRFLGSVYVNDIQNNPFQPDINYRGYTASPLLGTPQGLSVYMDGVRLNQPFGDVVSWDLIPRAAIASFELMPGSNPLFGLNTLGGALSIQTKDGVSNPGTSVQAYYGMNARWSVEFEQGGSQENGLNWYFTGNYFSEDGWRVDSPSEVGQIFGKVGWKNARTNVSLTVAYADTDLTGNGLQEQRFLARDYASVYTKPDTTKNTRTFVNLLGEHRFSDNVLFSGNAYYRNIRTSTLNGDINDDSLGENVYQPNAAEQEALADAGYTGFPDQRRERGNTPFPYWRCIANALLNTEPNEKCNGLLNRTNTSQQNYGVSGQLTWIADVAGNRNQLTAGAAYDASNVQFTQSTQFGYLNPDRSVTPVDAFADGTQDSENADDARVDLDGRTLHVQLVRNRHADLGQGVEPDAFRTLQPHDGQEQRQPHSRRARPGSLNGEQHVFALQSRRSESRSRPAGAFSAYFGYNEGSRAPSSIELGCADPENPCKLPNAMAGDPPLKQVVAKTLEAGIRGVAFDNLQWNLGVFRAENHDDILFVADNQSGFGYFRNFGKTRRQGIEAGLSGQFDILTLSASTTRTSTPPIRPKSSSTAAATAATTGRHRDSTATSSCVQAIACPSFRATWRRSTPASPSRRSSPWTWTCRPSRERSRAATRTGSTSRTMSTTWGRAARRATRSSTWGWPIVQRRGGSSSCRSTTCSTRSTTPLRSSDRRDSTTTETSLLDRSPRRSSMANGHSCTPRTMPPAPRG